MPFLTFVFIVRISHSTLKKWLWCQQNLPPVDALIGWPLIIIFDQEKYLVLISKLGNRFKSPVSSYPAFCYLHSIFLLRFSRYARTRTFFIYVYAFRIKGV